MDKRSDTEKMTQKIYKQEEQVNEKGPADNPFNFPLVFIFLPCEPFELFKSQQLHKQKKAGGSDNSQSTMK